MIGVGVLRYSANIEAAARLMNTCITLVDRDGIGSQEGADAAVSCEADENRRHRRASTHMGNA